MPGNADRSRLTEGIPGSRYGESTASVLLPIRPMAPICSGRLLAVVEWPPEVRRLLCSPGNPTGGAEEEGCQSCKDPITGCWVIISTDRAKRPMDFIRESVRDQGKSGYVSLCPGNEGKTPPEILAYGRNGGGRNTSGCPSAWCLTSSPLLALKVDWTARARGCLIE